MIERLLRRHFVRRFFDNDLISPEADRHEVMATLAAVLISAGLFVTFLMGFNYLSMLAQSPGRTAIGAISDRFFLFGCSMQVTALATLLSWNALSLDARDIAILGPLPIERHAMVRAKLGAAALVAAGFALVLNGATGVLYPILLTGKLPTGFAAMAAMVAGHAAVSLAAAAFGFLAVLACRELLHVVLGPARFARVSVPAHAGLTVGVIVTILLLPGMSADAARQWLVEPAPARWLVPPLWFVGLHEYLMSDTLMSLPYESLERYLYMTAYEAKFAALYAQVRPGFPALAMAAAAITPALALIALPAYWWNNRRFDGAPAADARPRRRAVSALVAAVVKTVVVRHPAAQAGFWLAFRSVTRSLPHRMAIGFGVAFGVATLTVGLPVAWAARATQAIPISALAPQLVVLAALVVAFHHAAGITADLRAGWIFKVAWLGEVQRYVAGVKRFAVAGLIAPAGVVLIPIHAALIGLKLAAAQTLLGSALAVVLLQVMFLRCDRLPFAVPRAATGTLKTRGPVYLVLTLGLVYAAAVLVRASLQNGRTFAIVLAGAAAVSVLLAVVTGRTTSATFALELDDAREEATQRLGLSG